MLIRSRALRGALLLAGGVLVGPPRPALAQESTTLRVEENFRREPNGLVLGRLSPGATLRVLDSRNNWTRVEIGGWVWLPSLQVSDDPDLDLVVAASGGENLRSEPSGPIVGRLVEGALLAELERMPGWARVARVGWVWTPSLDRAAGPPDEGGAAPARPPTAQTAQRAAPTAASGAPAARAPGGFVGNQGGAILTAPDGDTLAVAMPTGDLQVLRREGNWVRVRVEGWMWLPVAEEGGTVQGVSGAALEPADLAADPAAHTGRVVEWSLQFISLERAEAVRTDFFPGEPFLLTRFGGQDGPFVYVAVPPDRLTEVQGLLPLERVVVTGRIRTGASALTGVPIVDLLDIVRSRGNR